MLISTAISVVQKGMRVIAISEEQGTSKQQLLDAHHRLRAKVFSGRIGWEVAVTDGRETDAFDALQPDYILALSTSGEVAGCAGLLPALGAIASAKREVGHPFMVESSRFCVDAAPAEGRGASTGQPAGIIEWFVANVTSKSPP